MNDYYDLLGISQNAGNQDIKRAYFGLVKKFTPERFPDEFKKIRAAYDTLTDDKKRAEYDRRRSLPDAAAKMLNEALGYTKTGRHKLASETLSMALKLFPDENVIKEKLAYSLREDDKSGLAAKRWEELCKQNPDNAKYAYELARSYTHRGWNKKAIAEYERSVLLDGSDPDVWESYIDCLYENEKHTEARLLCQRAIQALHETGKKSLLLNALGIHYWINHNEEIARDYLREMKSIIQGRPSSPKDESTLEFVLDSIMTSKKHSMYPAVRELADLLPRISSNFEHMLDRANLLYCIYRLTDSGFDDVFENLFVLKYNDCSCNDCECNLASAEVFILDNLISSRQQINRLKKEYPQLYEMHSSFLNEVLYNRDPERMIRNRIKLINKRTNNHSGNIPSQQETVRRETPKIGRNDPCPCGSGKKYKHCCGAEL